MGRSTPSSPGLTVTLLLAAALQTAGLAKPLQEPPSTASLRAIQLAAQICGRDNSEASCARTRELADPLMDHTTLSASCTDTVFDPVPRAPVREPNSERPLSPPDTSQAGCDSARPEERCWWASR